VDAERMGTIYSNKKAEFRWALNSAVEYHPHTLTRHAESRR